jgi:peptidoglycan hydrolase CwlO-like protein
LLAEQKQLQTDLDKLNNLVDEYNALIDEYNQTGGDLNDLYEKIDSHGKE